MTLTLNKSFELLIFSIIEKNEGTDPQLLHLSIKHLSLCTDTDNDGFSFILVKHEESTKMSHELLILLKFKLLQYIYYNISFQLYLVMQEKLNSN